MLPAPLLATIEREQPASTLLIQPDPLAVGGTPPSELHANGIRLATPAQLLEDSFSKRTDLVFISSECLYCEKDSLMQLVAKCRDLLSSRVLIEMDTNATLEEADMLALAFTRYAETALSSGEALRYFYFDLKTYKPVPDWLNPKFWANPQNWGKYRW